MVEFFEQLIGKEAKDHSPSPFGKWLNGKVVAVERGRLEVSFEPRPEMANPGGILHGGAISAMIDELMGMTVFTLGKEGFYVAINLNVDFLRPGKIGETITLDCQIIREGRTMVYANCSVFNSEKKLIAKASSNLMLSKL